MNPTGPWFNDGGGADAGAERSFFDPKAKPVRLKNLGADGDFAPLVVQQQAAAVSIQAILRAKKGRQTVQTIRTTFAKCQKVISAGEYLGGLVGLRKPKSRALMQLRWAKVKGCGQSTHTIRSERERNALRAVREDAEVSLIVIVGLFDSHCRSP
jgi:hypothetical protein